MRLRPSTALIFAVAALLTALEVQAVQIQAARFDAAVQVSP